MIYTEIDTFQKVLEVNGETLEQFNGRTQGMSVATQGFEKVKAIAFALNNGAVLTEGYFPWFKNTNRSSVDFEYDASGYAQDISIVSRCHLFLDLERSEFAGKTFVSEYSQHINGITA